jgi:hypothetical protein
MRTYKTSSAIPAKQKNIPGNAGETILSDVRVWKVVKRL